MKPLVLSVILAVVSASPAAPLWSAAIDSRTTSQWLAESPGLVYALRGGHVLAIETANGSVLWRSAVLAQSNPAYVEGVLGVPVKDGIAFLDGKTGKLYSVYPMRGSVAIARGQREFVAVRYGLNVPNVAIGFHPDGRIAWKRPLESTLGAGAIITTIGGDAVGVQRGDTFLILDARNGNAVAQTTYVDELIGADGRYLWFTVSNGGIKGLDLDTNRSVAVHGHVIRKAASVEHGIAVAVIDGRLHALDLRSGRDRQLHIDGRWIGGPIGGKILVERGDGLYVQSLQEGSRPVRVARYSAESRIVTSDRTIAYVGLIDGTIYAIDMHAARVVQRISTACRFYEGFTASGTTAIVHCDDDSAHSRLVAFDRAALSAK